MMTKLLIYGYCVGVCSSRGLQKGLVEDVGFRVLAAGNEPDFRTISDFRKLHLGALQGLFDQVLQIALQAGTMKLGRVVLDGSKVKANASKHKAMSYGRMQEEEKRLKEEGQRVTQASNDKQQLKPTVEAIGEQAGQKPQEVLTDSGYCSDANLKYLEKKKIEGFIATDRESYRGRQQPGPRGPLPQEATRVD